jgi:hypothetical protein
MRLAESIREATAACATEAIMSTIFPPAGPTIELLGVTPPVSSNLTGSGDKIFDWAQAIGLLLVTRIRVLNMAYDVPVKPFRFTCWSCAWC